ncbi:MAG TPA: GNAT family N-acetyltransferase [Pirellulales bacterium]|jgi:RimJ/RimL family protein N-acetyltransferase|nr:GNAT family N-acetyltransferase [Pirellulales bacterium]
MDHDVYAAGHEFALRPIRLSDAPLVVQLRSDAARAQFLNPVSAVVADQEAYLRDYLGRPGDLYFVVESQQPVRPEGLIALYDIDPVSRRAEVGRWILRPGSTAAVESMWLVYRVAFDVLGVAEVFCRTVAENTHALSFHDSCGLQRTQVWPRDVRLGERWFDRIEHALSSDAWPIVEAKLSQLAGTLASRGHACQAA